MTLLLRPLRIRPFGQHQVVVTRLVGDFDAEPIGPGECLVHCGKLDFGHHHLGFTLGPVTGRLLAEMMTRETPFTDPAPYRAERF